MQCCLCPLLVALSCDCQATFEVVGDGKVLFTSEPVTSIKVAAVFLRVFYCHRWFFYHQTTVKCDVSVLGVTELELRVSVLESSANVHAVWVDPVVTVRCWSACLCCV
jgi:hypothetical protein